MRPAWKWMLVVAPVIAGAAVIAALYGAGSSADVGVSGGAASSPPSPGSATPPTASSAPSTPASLTEQEATRSAEAVLRRFLGTSAVILERGDGDASAARAEATGFVLGEIEAAAAERHDLGLRQVGAPDLVSASPLKVDVAGKVPVVQMSVCLDVSALDYVDAAGRSQKARLYQPSGAVQHIYGIELVGASWLVATHSIPATSNCPVR